MQSVQTAGFFLRKSNQTLLYHQKKIKQIMKKYELTEETKEFHGRNLYRIRAVMDFGNVRKGDFGGYIEKESNLAQVYGDAWVYGDAMVHGDADYVVFKNWWSSGRYFTWTKSNDMWKVGCFFGTGQELIEKAYKDSKKSGREYERIVNYVEEIKSITL